MPAPDAVMALNHIENCVQRGGDGSDIGAFEVSPPPTLSITRQAHDAVISWPGYYADFQLESAATLVAPNVWNSVTNAVSNNGTNFWVTVPANTGNQFYRLRNP